MSRSSLEAKLASIARNVGRLTGQFAERLSKGPIPILGGVLVAEGGQGRCADSRCISSAVVAPVAAAWVRPVCRRSWNRRSDSPAAFRACCQYRSRVRAEQGTSQASPEWATYAAPKAGDHR
jgi:hypothetical protein